MHVSKVFIEEEEEKRLLLIFNYKIVNLKISIHRDVGDVGTPTPEIGKIVVKNRVNFARDILSEKKQAYFVKNLKKSIFHFTSISKFSSF